MTDTQTHFTVGPSQKEGMSSADQASVNVSLWPGGFDPVKENDSHMWALAEKHGHAKVLFLYRFERLRFQSQL